MPTPGTCKWLKWKKIISVPFTVSEGCEQPTICVYQVTRKYLVKIILSMENWNANSLFFLTDLHQYIWNCVLTTFIHWRPLFCITFPHLHVWSPIQYRDWYHANRRICAAKPNIWEEVKEELLKMINLSFLENFKMSPGTTHKKDGSKAIYVNAKGKSHDGPCGVRGLVQGCWAVISCPRWYRLG